MHLSSPTFLSKKANGHRKWKNRKTENMTFFKIIIDEGHVLGYANFIPGRQICVFTRSRCFFSMVKNDYSFFFKSTARTPIKYHSQGIHEDKWHQCDLRKKFCAYGGIGSHILSKTDLSLRSSSKYPNHIVNLILGCFSPF